MVNRQLTLVLVICFQNMYFDSGYNSTHEENQEPNSMFSFFKNNPNPIMVSKSDTISLWFILIRTQTGNWNHHSPTTTAFSHFFGGAEGQYSQQGYQTLKSIDTNNNSSMTIREENLCRIVHKMNSP